MKYKTLADGEARTILGRRGTFFHKIRCCDCSLTHLVVMKITSPSKAEFVAWRDMRATAAARRGKRSSR